MHHLKRRELLEAHFELGLFFKEQIIPKAYLFFTRGAIDGAFLGGKKSDHTKRPNSVQAKLKFSNKSSSNGSPMKMSKKNSKCNEHEDKEKIKEKHEESIDSAIEPEMEGDNSVDADGEAKKINSLVTLYLFQETPS